MNWQIAVGVALAGSLALACAGEQRSEEGADDAQLVAEQRPSDGRPAGEQPPSGAQPPAGEQRPTGEPQGAPWVPPRSGCEPQTTSIYYTGILTSMTTGEASCSRQILVCGDRIRTDKRYNSKQGEKCPWADGLTIAFREDGADVCCDEWEKAKQSKVPCDPLADADCDGIPNDDDDDTLTAGATSPD